MAEAEALLQAAWDAGDAQEAARWSAWVDAHDSTSQAVTASLGGSALWYAKRGLRVFPLRPGGKQPQPGSHGCKDATSDTTRVAQWWGAEPHANIGIATGHLVDVIDVDGPQGNVSLTRLLRADPEDPECEEDSDLAHRLGLARHPREGTSMRLGHVLTPRPGGRHYYVPASPGGRGNGASLAPGIDYRGRGGYVVAPPSRTEVGVYRWVGAPTL